jgi:multiple sugar transport system ATP-binding protein
MSYLALAEDVVAEVKLDRVTKVYPNGFEAVSDLSLDVADGEFMVVVGPSGCGKSTLLRMIAGLEDISSGDLRVDGRLLNNVRPGERDMAMVFQDYALYPHMTVAENISFPLRLSKVGSAQRRRAAEKTADLLGLSDYLESKPNRLSGGQRQRVAMGRAMVRQPTVFLMDEPLSNLDAKLRVQMRGEICSRQRDLGVTTFYVTHDQIEAMTMGDRVTVLRDGVLQQVASPKELYRNPSNVFVATFIGSPPMNLFEGVLEAREADLTVCFGDKLIPLPAQIVTAHAALRERSGQTVILGIRPEDIQDGIPEKGSGDLVDLEIKVQGVDELGGETLVHFDLDAKEVVVDLDSETEETLTRVGTRCIARFGSSSQVTIGDRRSVSVPLGRLYFFDRLTHLAL